MTFFSPPGIACFDFDWSLVEQDSDRYVFEQLSPVLRQRLENPVGQWTDLLNACLKEYYEDGGRRKDIVDALCRVPMDPAMIEFCKQLHAHGWKLVILSDANQVYIQEILRHHGILDLFDRIITNPAYWNPPDEERLVIRRLIGADQPPHQCPLGICSLNICKGQELDAILAEYIQQQHKSIQMADGTMAIVHPRLLYVGDGRNDYCPSLRLSTADTVFARRGRYLEKMMLDEARRSVVKASVVFWATPSDILTHVQSL
ncbi:hypothetical protein BGZ73_004973 [Actinomortierella ambigua]|nr:hypothetical protein BGZ73_004973 [Actinomortierella ambigua]